MVSREVRKLLMASLVEAAFHRRKWFCKQWKRFYLERLFRLGARFHNFVGNDWFARWCINFLGGIEVPGQQPNHEISISVLHGTSAGRTKQQLKANRGVRIIVAQNNQSSQTSIPVKRRRRTIRTKTLKCKQITAEIKTGKQRRCD